MTTRGERGRHKREVRNMRLHANVIEAERCIKDAKDALAEERYEAAASLLEAAVDAARAAKDEAHGIAMDRTGS